MNGWTALAGVEEVGAAKAGETVLVSAASGCTGMLAAQVAKNLGCTVLGLAGSAEKCRFLEEEIGIDRAIDYKRDDVGAALAELDEGVDVYFDNVGGPLLDAVLPNMALYGRIAICGLLAEYEEDAPIPGPARFDQILMRRLRVEGFFSPDFAHRGPDYVARLRGWHEEGRLKLPFDVTQGLENAVKAYERLFSGANIGKVLVDL
jgi:NADPH-dependent curcumin reductase CurA